MKAVLKVGQRQLDLITEYTGHPYDPVLGIYYARARMYDAADRRFMAADQWSGWHYRPDTLIRYLYCINNPLIYVDLTGRTILLVGSKDEMEAIKDILQLLTNDTLKIQESVYPDIPTLKAYRIVIGMKNNGTLTLNAGTELIRELIKSPFRVTIRHGDLYGTDPYSYNGLSIFNGTGNHANIYIDTKKSYTAYTVDSSGNIVNSIIPDYIALGHELVHAYQMVTGTVIPLNELSMSIYKTSTSGRAILYIERTNELRTVGLNYYPILGCATDVKRAGLFGHNIDRKVYGDLVPYSDEKYSENALRSEHGLPLRIAYEPAGIKKDGRGVVATVSWNVAISYFYDFSLPG